MKKAKNICNEEILVLENMQDYEKLEDKGFVYFYSRSLNGYRYIGHINKKSIQTISFDENGIKGLNGSWFSSEVVFVVIKEDLKEELKDE